jgi:virginiamycin B lyase
MTTKMMRLRIFRVLSLALLVFTFCSADVLIAAPEPAVLTGIVTSQAEGAMEGVLVSAKRTGGTTTITVVSDKQGRYAFPKNRLIPGEYHLSIRAVGYDLSVPEMTATVGKGQSKTDIKLVKTRDLAGQLTDVEWLMSVPGTPAQKEWLSQSCVLCHNLTHVFKSTYDQAGWMTTLVRMSNYSGGSAFYKPQVSPWVNHEMIGFKKGDEELAKYLASINLSSQSDFKFELKTLPRPKGESTKVIITEYDLPRTDSIPHDAAVDANGMIWYCDFNEGIIGRLNPRTGETKEWQDPSERPGFPGGFQAVDLDKAGNPWAGRHEYNGIAKFDVKTEKFTNWSIPGANPKTRTTFLSVTPDEKVWIKDNVDYKVFRLDPATGKFAGFDFVPEDLKGIAKPNMYGMNADSQGNLYAADIDGASIARIDAQTGKATVYPTPTPNSGPRRMHFDSKERLWIGEYYANKIAVFDTKSEKFQEWTHPVPWYGPYDVAPAKDGFVWTGAMASDLITRFNPQSGEFRNYLLPRVGSNVRRVDVDNSGARPIFWVAECHQAKIAKVEPLD